jgi:hypothetical protein
MVDFDGGDALAFAVTGLRVAAHEPLLLHKPQVRYDDMCWRQARRAAQILVA